MHRATTAAILASAVALLSGPAYAVAQQGAVPAMLPATLSAMPAATPAATKSPSPTSTASPTSSTPTPKPFSPPAAPAGAVSGAPAVKIEASSTWKVQIDPRGAKWLSQSWPSAETVFSQAELAQAIPGLSGVQASDCKSEPLAGGDTSAHSTRCTLTLLVNGAPSQIPTRLMVNVVGFGTPDQVGKKWQAEFARQQARAAKRPGLYTFYANGNNGAASSYTDGTTTRVLLTKGAVTGELSFSGVGFTFLADDYLTARKVFRDRIVPELVQLLAAKMSTVEPPA